MQCHKFKLSEKHEEYGPQFVQMLNQCMIQLAINQEFAAENPSAGKKKQQGKKKGAK